LARVFVTPKTKSISVPSLVCGRGEDIGNQKECFKVLIPDSGHLCKFFVEEDGVSLPFKVTLQLGQTTTEILSPDIGEVKVSPGVIVTVNLVGDEGGNNNRDVLVSFVYRKNPCESTPS